MRALRLGLLGLGLVVALGAAVGALSTRRPPPPRAITRADLLPPGIARCYDPPFEK